MFPPAPCLLPSLGATPRTDFLSPSGDICEYTSRHTFRPVSPRILTSVHSGRHTALYSVTYQQKVTCLSRWSMCWLPSL